MTTPVRVRTDVTHGRNGAAGVRVGGQPEARADAYKRIREFFAKHLGS
jgi:dienelactone hydrolase